MRLTHQLALFTAGCLVFSTFSLPGQDKPERLLYLSGVQTLAGHVYKPQGKGPFPVIVFAQASMSPVQLPKAYDPFPLLARSFTSRGYVFFVPGRHSLGAEPEQPKAGMTAEAKLIRAHELQAANLTAAVACIKAQSYVDENRVVMLGDSAGAVSSLLAVHDDISVAAMILFSPGTQALKGNPKMELRMKEAVRKAKAPILVIQTKNDVNMLPTEILGPELEKKGIANYIKIFPAYGNTPSEAHKFLVEGYALWQTDVSEFLEILNDPAGSQVRTN